MSFNDQIKTEKEKQSKVVDNGSDITSTKSREGPATPVHGVKEDEEAALGRHISNRPDYSSFSLGEKRFIVFMAAFAGFFSPLSANIYFPVSSPSFPTVL
jgi:hypothetical protein